MIEHAIEIYFLIGVVVAVYSDITCPGFDNTWRRRLREGAFALLAWPVYVVMSLYFSLEA